MALQTVSSHPRDDSRNSSNRVRGPEQSHIAAGSSGHMVEVKVPRWSDIFYVPVAFGTASAIFWMAGF